MTEKNGYQIIYINGPSSCGKTTLAHDLQQELKTPFLHIGIDCVIEMMPQKLNNWEGGAAPDGFSWKATVDSAGISIQEIQLGPFARKMSNTLKEIVLTMAKMGHYIIIDDVALGNEDVEKWRSALQGYHVLWIGIHSSLEQLEEREMQRNDRIQGSARAQYFQVHKGVVYDMEFDTSQQPMQKIVEAIKLKLNQPIKDTSVKDYEIVYQETISAEDEAILIQGIIDNALRKKQMSPIRPFAFLIKDNKSNIVGGIKGASFYGCHYIDSIWVKPDLQGCGWGSRLMQAAEELGRERHCSFLSLTTMDWEALPFYKKLGYEMEYIRQGFEKDSKMYILRKKLQ